MENWKKIISEYQNKDKKKILRYVACEDLAGKRWIFYDPVTNQYDSRPFGAITMEVLNIFKTYESNNVHFTKYHNRYTAAGILNLNDLKSNLEEVQPELDELIDFISNLKNFKAKCSEAHYFEKIMEIWLKYRDCTLIRQWKCYLQLLKEEKEANENILSSDLLNQINSIASNYQCIYHDTMLLDDSNQKPVIGRTFLLNESSHFTAIFRWDLLHVLTGNAPVPHACKRCGQLYTSNKNTSKYCPECSQNRNAILNENRKANTCGYLHKRILDKLNSSSNLYKIDKKAFLCESNYYKAVVHGKIPNNIPKNFDSSIQTEADYQKWLESILPNPYTKLKNRY